MHHLWATLAVAISALPARLRRHYHDRTRHQDPDAGIETVEIVVITVFVLGLAAVVVLAITTFVNGELDRIVSPNG
ncbi:hypothetical protein [Myceligenerans crystallogenes]|uniref:Uncharacterized protein n=1 Tax=Myceligenerans crystallogenes TaxID=316335 RepID=A0ABN2NQC6_9MICO